MLSYKKFFFYTLLLSLFLSNLVAQEVGADEIEALLKESSQREQEEIEAAAKKTLLERVVDRASIPNLTVVADIVADLDIVRPNQSLSHKYLVREVELVFNGAIDHWALGTLNIAMHSEGGNIAVDLHEVYVEFPTLLWNFYLKTGKFFYDIGRLNNFHRHDWPFVTAPLAHQMLFGNEGVEDTGAELAYLMPWPFFQELKFGVFMGRTFGHTHVEGEQKPHPLYTLKLKHFFLLPADIGLQWGFSFLRYNVTTNAQDADYTYGTDLTFRWQKSQQLAILFSNELWYREEQRHDVLTTEKKLGLYSYVQVKFLVMFYAGFRFDIYSDLNQFSLRTNTRAISNNVAQVLWFTVRPSEFSTYRIEFERQHLSGEPNEYILRLQITFILGHHPVHQY